MEPASRHAHGSRSQPCWLCLCDCGHLVNVLASSLARGNSQSCGECRSPFAIEIVEIISRINIKHCMPRRDPIASRRAERIRWHRRRDPDWRQ